LELENKKIPTHGDKFNNNIYAQRHSLQHTAQCGRTSIITIRHNQTFFSLRIKQPRKSQRLQQFSFPSVPAPLQDDNVTTAVRLLRSTTQQSIALLQQIVAVFYC